MRLAGKFALAVCFGLLQLGLWCHAQIHIPGPNEGYELTPSDIHQNAPAGYEGRTDVASQTAVGNTPETAGKSIVSQFTLGNQVQTCPDADGLVEGSGIFSMSVDYTDA